MGPSRKNPLLLLFLIIGLLVLAAAATYFYLSIFYFIPGIPNTTSNSQADNSNPLGLRGSTSIPSSTLPLKKLSEKDIEDIFRTGRDLTEEEKVAFVRGSVDDETLIGALVNYKEVICETEDVPLSMALMDKYYIKDGKMRIEGYGTGTEPPVTSIITNEGVWIWWKYYPENNTYTPVSGEYDKLMKSGFGDEGNSKEIFASSCEYTKVEDGLFIAPPALPFETVVVEEE